MILVDSSAWIAYFSPRSHPSSAVLEQKLASREEIVLSPLVLTEVLAGFREERAFVEAREALLRVQQIPLSSEICLDAALLYRNLRKKGVTVRGIADCLIAQTCLTTGAGLLTLDSDFHHIAQHSALKLISWSSKV